MPQPASSRRPAQPAPRPRARATPAAAALHAVFELSEAALLLLDAAGCLTRANAPAAALLGQPAAALAGARLADLLPAEAGEPLLSAVAAAEPQRARRCTLRPAGGPPADFWLDVTPLPAGCLLRLRPAASPAADQPFADLFHRAPDALGISHWDSGQYLLINDAFTTLTGYPAADVLGRTLLELGLWVNPAERDVLRERVRAGGEVNNVEVQLRRRDGQVFAALISARLLEYAGATCILLAARDISERYQMEAALRASEERYRLVSELASDFAFSFSVGPDGQPRLEWITDAWTRATGYSREAAARSATWRQVIHPDDYPAVERALAEVLAGQSREIEARVVRADGALRRQLIRGHPRRDSAGRVVGLYGAAQDITAHLQAEAGRRETETRQHALLDAMPDDMFRFTLDGTFLDFHSNNLASLAMAPDSIRGARLDQSPLPPEFAARVLAAARQAVRTGQLQTLEYSLALPAGPRWFEARLAASGPDEAVAVVRDVTARRQADEALRASEERYRLISELMSDFAFAYDFNPDGSARLAWITAEAFTRLTGQPADRAADLYNFLGSSAVLPEDVPLVAAAVQRARAGEAVETEWRMYTEAGELRWLRTAARPRLDSAGRVAGIFGAIHDITAAKQAEQARRESEALSRSILDVLSEGVVVQDQAGAIIFSNASAEQILGLTTDQMAGRSSLDPRWRSIYPDGTPLPGIDHPAMVALRTGEPQTDVIMGVHRPDGTLVWISINSRPVDAAHTQVATSFTDITRRRQTETALQAELAFRQALEETLPTGLAVADVRDHAIIYVNPGLCQLLGYPAEELLNDRPPYKYWPSELAAAYQAAFARALADQLPAEGLELTFRRKSGERFQALVVTALVRDAAQQPRGLLASISDITPLRRAADALQRSNQRLEALRALSRSILAARSPAQVAASALQHLRPLVPHDNAWLFMYEAASPEPVCLASAGVSDAWTQPDPALELDQAGWRDLPSGAWLVVPVWTGSQLVGSLILADGAAGRFSQSELDIAAEVVDELAVALQQARLLQAEMRRRQELEAIADVSAALRLATSSAAVAQILVAQAVALMHAEGGVLLAGQTTWTVLAVWHAADSPAAPPPALDEAAVRLLRGDAPGAPDFQAEPAPNRTQLLRRLLPEALAYASAPLRVAEQLPGLLVLGWSRPPAFGTPDQHLLAAVTELGSNALQRSNLLETLERRVAARTHDLMALYDVAALATETLDRPALLQRALMYGLQATGAAAGAVYLAEPEPERLVLAAGQGLPAEIDAAGRELSVAASREGQVLRTGEALVLPDSAADPRVRHLSAAADGPAFAGLPIRHQGRTLGVLVIWHAVAGAMSAEAVALLGAIADQIGAMLMAEALRRQAERAAVMEERQRLARDLHDSITQTLYSVILFASAAETQAAAGQTERAQAHLRKLRGLLQQALRDMRLLIFELRPGLLEEMGLVRALQHRLEAVEHRAQINYQLRTVGDLELPDRLEHALYAIAQEALNNALKHSGADQVVVDLQAAPDRITLSVADNGQGFDEAEAAARGGAGLRNMRERVERLGGRWQLQTGPGQGTRVEVELKR